MEETTKETSIFAIFSFLLAAFALVYEFFINHECDTMVGNLTGVAAVIVGIIGLIWMKRKNQAGKGVAILGIILGLLAASLVSLC